MQIDEVKRMTEQAELAMRNYEVCERQWAEIAARMSDGMLPKGGRQAEDAAKAVDLSIQSVRHRLDFMNKLPTPEREMCICNFLFGKTLGYQELLLRLLTGKGILDSFFHEVREESRRRVDGN